MSDEYIDERIQMPGVGRGRDLGLDLAYTPGMPLRSHAGQPRAHSIPVSSEVAGDRSNQSGFTRSPISGSWGPALAQSFNISGLVMGGQGVLRGFGIMNTSATNPATVYILGGIDANAPLLVPVTLAANESVRDFFGESGIRTDRGLYVNVISGTVYGSIYSQQVI